MHKKISGPGLHLAAWNSPGAIAHYDLDPGMSFTAASLTDVG